MGTLRIGIPGIHPSAASIEDVVARHGNQVYQMAFNLTGSTADAEDVTQTVFLKLFNHWIYVSKGVNVGAWLNRVATNASIDVLRRRQRSRAANTDDGTLDAVDSGERPPEGVAENRELGERLEAALATLPPHQRAAVVLFDHEGLKGKEIARILNVTEAAVRSYVHVGRQKLKALLSPYLKG